MSWSACNLRHFDAVIILMQPTLRLLLNPTGSCSHTLTHSLQIVYNLLRAASRSLQLNGVGLKPEILGAFGPINSP